MNLQPSLSSAIPPALLPLGLSTEQLQLLGKVARVELAKQCASEGNVLGWGAALMPEKFNLPFCDLHRYIVDHRLDPFVALEAPRGHAKTTVACGLVPMYQSLEEADTFNHYLQVQATDDKAMAVNTNIKLEFEQNELIRYAYGPQVGEERWTNGQFVTRKNICFSAVGAGQSIRGINYRNRRPDYIMPDDLYNEDDINNPESTIKKNNWFWSTLYPARAKGRKSCTRLTGTPANNEDLLKELATKLGWTFKSFKAAEDIDKGPVLWPELNTLADLQRDMNNMPIVIFYREMMCERRDTASSIVKSAWLEAWEYDPVDLKFNEHLTYLAGVLGIDPSIGKNEENDPAAFAFVLKAQRDDGTLPIYYIEALREGLMTLQQRLDTAKELCGNRPRERPATLINTEAISGFQDFGDMLAGSVSVPCNLIKKVPDKITHLEKKSHYFQNKRIFLNRNIPDEMKKKIVYQLTTNHPKHDDVRDALLQALDDESGSWSSWV